MPARILIVRLSAMGDVVHAMPAVAALRRAHPGAHIGWAIEPAWAPLLGPELVDKVHLVPSRRWTRSPLSPRTWREIRMTRAELKQAGYDVALDMQGNVRSALIQRWSGAPRRIGEAHPREPLARLFYNQRVAHSSVHIIDQDLELASAIFNDKLSYVATPFPVDHDAQQWAEAVVSAHPAAKFAMLLPGAGWGTKRWPPERYGEVARELSVLGFHSFINIGPGEEALGFATASVANGAATALPAALPRLIELLRRCSLCIGGDTGPLHLACALGVPTVGIFGPKDPARNGPYAVPSRVLRHAQSVRDHSRKRYPERGLLTITPGEAVLAARDLLLEVER